MSLIVLVSPGGSPGVTTTGLALALAWPRKVVLAECDPAGGAVLAGLWRGQPPEGAGSSPAGAVRAAGPESAWPAAGLRRIGPAVRAALPPVRAARPGRAAGRMADRRRLARDGRRVRRRPRRRHRRRLAGSTGQTALAPLLAAAGMPTGIRRLTIRQAAAALPRLATLAGIGAGGWRLAGPGRGGTLRPGVRQDSQPGPGGPGPRQPPRRPGHRRRPTARHPAAASAAPR